MSKRKLRYFIVNKPYNMLSQFTPEHDKIALSSLDKLPKDIYPIGRLDYDSEGLLLLTNDRTLNQEVLEPKNEHAKTYFVQIEGIPSSKEINSFSKGLTISVKGSKHFTLPATMERIDQPSWITERNPPVGNKTPTCWVKITLKEGKNRQVRKMTAAINHPTLRLVRGAIENLSAEGLEAGKFIELSKNTVFKKLNISTS
jgi:23S rRNA pseudouridine2457 synthase